MGRHSSSRLSGILAALSLVPGCYVSHGIAPEDGDAGAPRRMDAARDAAQPWTGGDAAHPPMDAAVVASMLDASVLDGAVLDAADASVLDAGTGRDATVWLDAGACGPAPDAGVVVSPHTIDRFELSGHAWGPGFRVFPYGAVYHLSDGTSWNSGAGSATLGVAHLVRVERVGTSLRYHLMPEPRLLERTDYDSGDHSAHYALDAVAQLVLVAEEGGRVGVIRGEVRVALDEPANYRDTRFHHLSAPLCSIVPFVVTYTLDSPARFTETLFDTQFDYAMEGTIDFTSARP